MFGVVPTRSLVIDDAIAEVQPQQLVVLGAGFDSRGHSLSGDGAGRPGALPPACVVFEVDAPATQRLKRLCVATAAAGRAEPRSVRGGDRVRFVPCDFNDESWRARLEGEPGFDATLRTLYVWEGVSYYLPPDVVESTLRDLAVLLRAGAAAGSLVAVDVFADDIVRARNARGKLMQGVLRIVGEPLLYGVASLTGLAEWAAAFGLRVTREEVAASGDAAVFVAVAAES